MAEWTGSRVSYRLLASALESHMRARLAREEIDNEGMTATGRDGQTKAHPLCAVERDNRAAFRAGMKALGIKL